MKLIQSTVSRPIPPRCILILSFQRLSLSNSAFPSGFQTQIVGAFFMSHACYKSFQSRNPWFDDSNNIRRRVQYLKLHLLRPFCFCRFIPDILLPVCFWSSWELRCGASLQNLMSRFFVSNLKDRNIFKIQTNIWNTICNKYLATQNV
jgi:hypothetical protein